MTTMTYRLLTLGKPSLLCADGCAATIGTGKPFAILAFLALERGPVGRDDLANMFWAQSSQRAGRSSVRQALSLIRTHLGAGIINSDEATVVLNHDLLVTDTREFSEALTDGRMRDANALWRGAFMERIAFLDAPDWSTWVEEQRSDLEREYSMALHRAAQCEWAAGRARTALDYARTAVALVPQNPALHVMRFEASLALRNIDELTQAMMDARRSFREMPGILDMARWEREESVLRAASRGPTIATGPRIEFVGRSEQVADLRALWLNARRGSMRTAFLSGPTGIGKTRLAEEIAELASRDRATVISIKCAEGERSIKWGLAASLATRLLRVPGASGASTATDAVLASLTPGTAAAFNRRNGRASNGHTSDHSGNGSGPRTFDPSSAALADAFIDLVSCVGNDKLPLFIHIDDLQWCDGPSRALLARVLRTVREASCMFVVTYRSEDATPALLTLVRALARESAATVVELPALSAGEVRELLGLTLALDGDELVATLAERAHAITGGNPLFLTELIRALHDEGIIHNGQGQFAVDASRIHAAWPWPRSLQAVVDRRLDRLSQAASVLVGHLARLPRGASVNELRERTEMSESAFTSAARELLSREVLRWLDDDRLDFTHDQLRNGALRRFPVAPLRAASTAVPRRRRPLVAAMAVLTVVAFGLTWQQVSSGEPDRSGGGTLFVSHGDSVFRALPGSDRNDPWTLEPITEWYPTFPERKGPFREASGQVMWFRDVPMPGGPDIARVTATGEETIVISGPGDENAHDLSPDGRWLLFTRNDPATDAYDIGLWLADTLGQSSRLLYQSPSAPTNGIWSPNGRRILITDRGVDSVFVIRPDRYRTAQYGMRQVEAVTWCSNERFAVLVEPKRDPAIVLVDVRSGNRRVLTNNVVLGGMVCSPDGTRIAYNSVLDHKVVVTVRNVDGEEITYLRGLPATGKMQPLAWLSHQPSQMPQRVSLRPPDQPVKVGDRVALHADVRYSNGNVAPDSLSWRSSNGGVASVSSRGVVSANAPGVAIIHAEWEGFIRDSIAVVVEDSPTAGQLLRESFAEIDTARWHLHGDPKPAQIRDGGGWALSLESDGSYSDGLIGKQAFSLSNGITLNLEFLLDIDNPERQRIDICLTDSELLDSHGESGSATVRKDDICFVYPDEARQHFDSATAHFGTSRSQRSVVSRHLPPREWTQLTIQVRPDGEATLFLNHQFVTTHPVYANVRPESTWRLEITSYAVGTPVLIRNLTVWGEQRYEVPTVRAPDK